MLKTTPPAHDNNTITRKIENVDRECPFRKDQILPQK